MGLFLYRGEFRLLMWFVWDYFNPLFRISHMGPAVGVSSFDETVDFGSAF